MYRVLVQYIKDKLYRINILIHLALSQIRLEVCLQVHCRVDPAGSQVYLVVCHLYTQYRVYTGHSLLDDV